MRCFGTNNHAEVAGVANKNNCGGHIPKHISRLLVLNAVVATIIFPAKYYFRADSFYQYGHYRSNAVAEIAAKVPKLQWSAVRKFGSVRSVISAQLDSGLLKFRISRNRLPSRCRRMNSAIR